MAGYRGNSPAPLLRTARISDPDDVQKLLHCEDADEFFGVGKFKEPSANKARKDRKKKIHTVLQSILATAGTGEESLHPRYSSQGGTRDSVPVSFGNSPCAIVLAPHSQQ